MIILITYFRYNSFSERLNGSNQTYQLKILKIIDFQEKLQTFATKSLFFISLMILCHLLFARFIAMWVCDFSSRPVNNI